MPGIPRKERQPNPESSVYNRTLLLHGSKRNKVLSLGEIERSGLDSFGDAGYIRIYGMKPREWHGRGFENHILARRRLHDLGPLPKTGS